jgi:asparagine synthase (glutamine-hydrolysing)
MAHGLELRAPFLDVDLAQFCIGLPARMKVDTDRDKILLRAAFQDAWPPSVRNRRKQGFGAPVTEWLRDPGVVSLIERHLLGKSAALGAIISPERLRALVARASSYQLWGLLVLGIWCDARGRNLTTR